MSIHTDEAIEYSLNILRQGFGEDLDEEQALLSILDTLEEERKNPGSMLLDPAFEPEFRAAVEARLAGLVSTPPDQIH